MSTTTLTTRLAASGVHDPQSHASRRWASDVCDADVAAFHAVRPRLVGIANRVLRDATEAEDVVQDTWIHWQTTDRTVVRDAVAFLARTTTHLAIHVIQSARARRETYVEPQNVAALDLSTDTSCDVERREAVELAIHALLEKLSPTERAAYLLREAFDYPYRELGAVLGLSEANARQVVTRARRRLSGQPRRPVAGAEQKRLVDVFVSAAQAGDLASLERLLSAKEADRVAA